LLEVKDLHAGYDDVPVLHGVSLSVGADECVALLGPNGHGKTTLLRTVSRLHPLHRGRVVFDGVDISARPPHELADLGLTHVPQGDLLFGDMTVEENLLVGAYRRQSWRRRREGLEEVWQIFPEIYERRAELARALSGGERRMVALGRGLMGPSKLLMIDEPSLGLAPVAIEKLYEALARLREVHVPMLLVEEAEERIADIADRVYVLDAGSIVAAGKTEELLADQTLLATYLG
jgi:branched-chain amino acid transport system ATP-binding protein